MPTTEIAIIPLVPGSDIKDPSNPATIALNECGQVVRRQDGIQQSHVGMQIEQPNLLVGFIDWDDIGKHEVWTKHPEYGPVNERLAPVFVNKGRMFHVDFEPHEELQKAIAAPVTEIQTLYFQGSPPDVLHASISHGLHSLVGKVDGLIASSMGMTHEELTREGVKGKALVSVIGWQSLEAHAAFEKTELYATTMGTMHRVANLTEAYHVAFVR